MANLINSIVPIANSSISNQRTSQHLNTPCHLQDCGMKFSNNAVYQLRITFDFPHIERVLSESTAAQSAV